MMIQKNIELQLQALELIQQRYPLEATTKRRLTNKAPFINLTEKKVIIKKIHYK